MLVAVPGRSRSMRRAGLLLAAMLVASGCGSGGDSGNRGGTAESVPASPFTFDPATVPAGYRLVTAGRGEIPQAWGDDSVGTDEPFTVLAPPGGDATSDDAVVVSVTGFEGYEGKLGQARRDRDQWTDVLEVRGDDLAVRVSGRRARADQLRAIGRSAVPNADHARAPAVEDPEGAQVIGSVDADPLVALRSILEPFGEDVLGPEGSFGAGWVTEDGAQLGVMSLRGDAADLDALPGLAALWDHGREPTVQRAEVGGEPAAILEFFYSENAERPSRHLAVIGVDPTGRLVVVVAFGPTVPARGELLALAGSVRPTSAEVWDDFVVDATGGPGLDPDPGAIEVARGTEGATEWLLQAWPDGDAAPPGHVGDVLAPGQRPVVDGCLKLATRKRVCPSTGTTQPGVAYVHTSPEADDGGGFPPFLIVESKLGGRALRITSGTGVRTVDFHQLPGSDRWVGVAFADVAALGRCDQLPRIEILDGAGRVVSCLAD